MAIFPVPLPQKGRALFSTHNGRFAPRLATEKMHVILRSCPEDDRDLMAATLQQQFPAICKTIIGTIEPQQVYEYFDGFDTELHGLAFLMIVLGEIARSNSMRSQAVQDFVMRWRAANIEAFPMIVAEHGVEHLFIPDDIKEHGHEFLTDAMVRIKYMLEQEKQEEATRIQQQHAVQQRRASMLGSRSELVLSHVPAAARFPSEQSAYPLRTFSDPARLGPGPGSHFRKDSIGQIRHITPPEGQFAVPTQHNPLPRLTGNEVLEHVVPARGDFHSDPVPIVSRQHHNSSIAFPARGGPGPYSYGTAPIPVYARQETFEGNVPKGKKNPPKRLTDDARMSGRLPPPHRYTSSPYPSAHSVWVGSRPPDLPGFMHPTLPNLLGQHQSNLPDPMRNNPTNLPSGQYQPSVPRLYNPESETSRPALATLPNAGQPPWHQITEARYQSGGQRPRKIGPTLWIGGLPDNITQAALLNLLQICRGLVDVSPPRPSTQGSQDQTFAFAAFNNLDCAVEALDRLPMTKFNDLPKGCFMRANWPFDHERPQGSHHRRRSGGNKDDVAMTTSPAKSRKASIAGGSSRGSPVKSRKASNVVGYPSSSAVAGDDNRGKQSRNSLSPQNTAGRATADNPSVKEPTLSDVRAGSQPAGNLLTQVTSEATTSIQKGHGPPSYVQVGKQAADNLHQSQVPSVAAISTTKDHETSADSMKFNSKGTKPSTTVKEERTMDQLGTTEGASPRQSSHQTGEVFTLDGAQESAPTSRNRKPAKANNSSPNKKKKSKPIQTNKSSVQEAKKESGAHVPPLQEKIEIETGTDLDLVPSDGLKSKAKRLAHVNDENQHSWNVNSSKMATTKVPPVAIPLAPRTAAPVKPFTTVQDPLKLGSSCTDQGNVFHEHAPFEVTTMQPGKVAQALSPVLNGVPTSQVTTRDPSMSAKDTGPSAATSTAPTSERGTERSNSVVEAAYLTNADSNSHSSQATQPTAPEFDPLQLRSKLPTNAAPGKSTQVRQLWWKSDEKATWSNAEASDPTQNSISTLGKKPTGFGKAAGKQAGKTNGLGHVAGLSAPAAMEEASKISPRKFLESPKEAFPLQTASSPPVTSQSPERKQESDTPPRSSSLPVSSTPIQTRHKKKTKNFISAKEEENGEDMCGAPGEEKPAEAVLEDINSSNNGQQSFTSIPEKSSLSKQEIMSKPKKSRRSNKPKDIAPSVLSSTLEIKTLPKPETPFHTDKGVTLLGTRLVHQRTPSPRHDRVDTLPKVRESAQSRDYEDSAFAPGAKVLPKLETPFLIDKEDEINDPKLEGPCSALNPVVEGYYRDKMPYQALIEGNSHSDTTFKPLELPILDSSTISDPDDADNLEFVLRDDGHDNRLSSRRYNPESANLAMAQKIFQSCRDDLREAVAHDAGIEGSIGMAGQPEIPGTKGVIPIWELFALNLQQANKNASRVLPSDTPTRNYRMTEDQDALLLKLATIGKTIADAIEKSEQCGQGTSNLRTQWEVSILLVEQWPANACSIYTPDKWEYTVSTWIKALSQTNVTGHCVQDVPQLSPSGALRKRLAASAKSKEGPDLDTLKESLRQLMAATSKTTKNQKNLDVSTTATQQLQKARFPYDRNPRSLTFSMNPNDLEEQTIELGRHIAKQDSHQSSSESEEVLTPLSPATPDQVNPRTKSAVSSPPPFAKEFEVAGIMIDITCNAQNGKKQRSQQGEIKESGVASDKSRDIVIAKPEIPKHDAGVEDGDQTKCKDSLASEWGAIMTEAGRNRILKEELTSEELNIDPETLARGMARLKAIKGQLVEGEGKETAEFDFRVEEDQGQKHVHEHVEEYHEHQVIAPVATSVMDDSNDETFEAGEKPTQDDSCSTAPKAFNDTLNADKNAIPSIEEPQEPAQEDESSLIHGSESGDVKSEDGTSATTACYEKPSMSIQGCHSPSKGRRQSYASLASGQPIAGGSKKKDKLSADNDVWRVPSGEFTWGNSAKGKSKTA